MYALRTFIFPLFMEFFNVPNNAQNSTTFSSFYTNPIHPWAGSQEPLIVNSILYIPQYNIAIMCSLVPLVKKIRAFQGKFAPMDSHDKDGLVFRYNP